MNLFSSNRRVQRVRHDLLAREVRVSRVRRISPGFLSITFTGESLASFVSLSFDDHVKLMLSQRGIFKSSTLHQVTSSMPCTTW